MYYSIRNHRTNTPLYLQKTYITMESKHSIPGLKEGVYGIEPIVSLIRKGVVGHKRS